MVLDFELPPGTPLAEKEMSERLEVSRTPIREALGRLAREGLVRQHPGRGAFVSEISVPDLVELYQLREALESYAGRLAAERIDDISRAALGKLADEFEAERLVIERGEVSSYYSLNDRLDEAITDLADNRRLADILSETWAQVRRARRVTAKRQTRLLASLEEHLSIIGAIKDGDAERAEDEIRRHVRRSLANITVSLASNLDS
jgi:DNA-binding GntR family transcriptional regulator